jgi:hypothetical protein
MGCGDIAGFADPGFGLVTGSGPFADKKKKKSNRHLNKYGEAVDFILGKTEEISPRVFDLASANAERYGGLFRSEAEKTRAAELDAFREYGPEYVDAISKADPLQDALRTRLNDTVLTNLDEGLDPSMRREVQQGTRAAYSDRGLADSGASAVEELLSLGTAGKALEERNVAAGIDLLGANQRVVGDPFLAVTGRPATPQGSNVMAPNADPFQNEGVSDTYNAYWQNRWQQQNRKDAKQAQWMQLAGSLISGAGSAAAGFI